MARLLLTHAARDDLEAIWRAGAERFGIGQAARYADALTARLRQLRDNPRLGAPAPDGLRRLVEGSHVAYYRIDGDTVIVLRVLHGAMDPGRHLPQ